MHSVTLNLSLSCHFVCKVSILYFHTSLMKRKINSNALLYRKKVCYNEDVFEKCSIL